MQSNFDYNAFVGECSSRKLTKQEKHARQEEKELAAYYPSYEDNEAIESRLTVKESL